MLREFFSHVDLFHLPLIATGLFIAMFVGVLVRVSRRARAPEYRRMASLPLTDGPTRSY